MCCEGVGAGIYVGSAARTSPGLPPLVSASCSVDKRFPLYSLTLKIKARV